MYFSFFQKKRNGHRLSFITLYTGVPIEPTDSGRNWTWLIVLCVLLFLLLVAILVAILICLHVKKKQREKAREKKILITGKIFYNIKI